MSRRFSRLLRLKGQEALAELLRAGAETQITGLVPQPRELIAQNMLQFAWKVTRQSERLICLKIATDVAGMKEQPRANLRILPCLARIVPAVSH
mmetsp:Transcript_45567/g.73987  ORF Transcript_45567/g.73987 Transcript_45567/m.73987 type:complete len:94 (-) Transcript_45567:1464-1745(-)